MSWQCRLIEVDPNNPAQRIEVGDMWYATDSAEFEQGLDYETNRRGKVPPLWIKLPSKDFHCLDSKSFDGKSYGNGWVIKGEPPNITVTPSINYIDRWHGWISNGVMSDDCDGRTY